MHTIYAFAVKIVARRNAKAISRQGVSDSSRWQVVWIILTSIGIRGVLNLLTVVVPTVL